MILLGVNMFSKIKEWLGKVKRKEKALTELELAVKEELDKLNKLTFDIKSLTTFDVYDFGLARNTLILDSFFRTSSEFKRFLNHVISDRENAFRFYNRSNVPMCSFFVDKDGYRLKSGRDELFELFDLYVKVKRLYIENEYGVDINGNTCEQDFRFTRSIHPVLTNIETIFKVIVEHS